MTPFQIFILVLGVAAVILAFIRDFVSDVRGMDLVGLGAPLFFLFMLLQILGSG